jgi:hypothetical protein
VNLSLRLNHLQLRRRWVRIRTQLLRCELLSRRTLFVKCAFAVKRLDTRICSMLLLDHLLHVVAARLDLVRTDSDLYARNRLAELACRPGFLKTVKPVLSKLHLFSSVLGFEHVQTFNNRRVVVLSGLLLCSGLALVTLRDYWLAKSVTDRSVVLL